MRRRRGISAPWRRRGRVRGRGRNSRGPEGQNSGIPELRWFGIPGGAEFRPVERYTRILGVPVNCFAARGPGNFAGMITRAPDIKTFRDLRIYQEAFKLQQMVFQISKRWPREETYSLTDQVRRSSRSIGANLAEVWAKRRYPAHLLSKLSDADGELQETIHWLKTASNCDYMTPAELEIFETGYDGVGRMLGSMMAKHEKFCLR